MSHACHVTLASQLKAWYVYSANLFDVDVLTLFITKSNLTLYSVSGFIILDSDGNRVLAKYYKPKYQPQLENKALTTLKDQRAFEKGLWEKTKKPGGNHNSIQT